jgi:1,4-dihydroxy-2-naphthoate octaprenyltransferase
MINDYFDFKSGCDLHPTYEEFWAPFFGGSRLLPEGVLNPRDVYIASLLSFAVSGIIGVYLALERGLVIVLLGVIGVLSGYFYVTQLATRGVGELFVGLNFGPLMVLGSYYVQAQTIPLEPLVASIPVGLLIAAVLWINEIPDYDADKRVGKNTLVVRLGRKRAADVYGVLMLSTYAVILLGISLSLMPVLTLLSFLSAPLAIRAVFVARRNYGDPRKLVPANAGTIRVHLFTGLLLCIAYVISAHITGL